jgi:hypothetical protein
MGSVVLSSVLLFDVTTGMVSDSLRNTQIKLWGVNVEKSDVKKALQSVLDQLDQFNYPGCYCVHGTTATALVKIAEDEGEVWPSQQINKRNGARHDIGDGVYCFKGDFTGGEYKVCVCE